MKITKKRKAIQGKVEANKLYSLEEASKLIKQVNLTKFDSSVDIHVRLGLDPTKADHALRGSVSLPNGIGKTKRVLVMCNPDKEEEAKKAGADFVGLDEFITKIEGGWMDFDVVVATPTVMIKIGKLGKVLGPRNLMPNPKTGTVTNEIAKTVDEIKGGKISFKIDKAAIIHSSIGRVSFDAEKIRQNAFEFIQTIVKLKPSSAKGNYIKSIALATTMSPSVLIDFNQLKL